MPDTPETRSTSRFARFWSLWISCGSCVGRFVVFGHVWFFGSGLRVRSCSCGFWSRVVFWIWSARPIVLMWFLWVGGLAFDAEADDCASSCRWALWICGFVDLWSCPNRCASSCSLWTAKKICSLTRFVLCFFSSSLGATFTNGENDHG